MSSTFLMRAEVLSIDENNNEHVRDILNWDIDTQSEEQFAQTIFEVLMKGRQSNSRVKFHLGNKQLTTNFASGLLKDAPTDQIIRDLLRSIRKLLDHVRSSGFESTE